MQELTEFFVSPHQQSAGVGRELLLRAFPKSVARYRTIIATLDERALYRYIKLGMYGRFPLKYFYRKAEKVAVETDLKVEPMQLSFIGMTSIELTGKSLITRAHININGLQPRAPDLFTNALTKSLDMDMSVQVRPIRCA